MQGFASGVLQLGTASPRTALIYSSRVQNSRHFWLVGLRQVRERWVQGITSWPLSTQGGAGMGAGRADP